jgi:hypothetical protein
MKQRPRIYYTETDKALMWDRWRRTTDGLAKKDVHSSYTPVWCYVALTLLTKPDISF